MLLIFPVLAVNPLLSQESQDTIYRNIVKINMAAAVFRNVSLFYERQFNDRWSAQLGAGYWIGGQIPAFMGLGDFVIESKSQGIRGFSITPEARYHFGNCDCGDQTGLYLGLYGRLTKYYGDVTFNYWNESSSSYIDVGGAGDIREFGAGLQLGYQFTIKKRILVDFLFMGPRLSFYRLNLEVDSDFASRIIPQIEEEINERLDWWGIDPISIPVDASTVVDFRFNSLRYAIAIGYMFGRK